MSARADQADQIEIVRGSDALLRWFVRLQQEAREEVLGLDRPPYVEAVQNPVEDTALGRGVGYRGVEITVYRPGCSPSEPGVGGPWTSPK